MTNRSWLLSSKNKYLNQKLKNTQNQRLSDSCFNHRTLKYVCRVIYRYRKGKDTDKKSKKNCY